MKKLTCVVAIVAAASTAAVAKDLKQDNKASSNAPTVSATQMNDAEMDNVTAGEANTNPGFGIGTACDAFGVGTCTYPDSAAWHANVSVSPGSGQGTH